MIEIKPNSITFDCQYIMDNLTSIIFACDFDLLVVLEFIELMKELQPNQTITILSCHHLFEEIKETINKIE